jgi:hypothetical protein
MGVCSWPQRLREQRSCNNVTKVAKERREGMAETLLLSHYLCLNLTFNFDRLSENFKNLNCKIDASRLAS